MFSHSSSFVLAEKTPAKNAGLSGYPKNKTYFKNKKNKMGWFFPE